MLPANLRRLPPLLPALAVFALTGAQAVAQAVAGAPLPIFDTHVHYSRGAWQPFGPERVLRILKEAGVTRALVSSTPDEGTLTLFEKAPDLIVPQLRPYHGEVRVENWVRHPDTAAYIARRLAVGIYRGIGEFHLFDASDVDSPQIKVLAGLAVARDIPVHVHSDAAAVRALFELEPKLKILWAHAGMVAPPEQVWAMLDRYPRLWTEVSFRAAEIAPAGRLDPMWLDMFVRHPSRFMIGTDTYANPRWEAYAYLIQEHRRWLALLPPPLAEAIAYGNAARLFGVSPL